MNIRLQFSILLFVFSMGNRIYAQGVSETADIDNDTVFIPAYSYHLKPPFIIDQPSELGMYFDLVNQLSDDKTVYYLIYMPRRRIDRLLQEDELDGIVVGVAPHWFKDRQQQKYFWTMPFIEDKDEIISSIENPFEYQRDSLEDKTMAGVRGFFYANVNAALKDNTLRRFDTESETQVIDMVQLQRVDFGIVSQSTLNYVNRELKTPLNVHISKQPHEAFARSILVPASMPAVYQHIQKQMMSLRESKQWTETIQQYGFDE